VLILALPMRFVITNFSDKLVFLLVYFPGLLIFTLQLVLVLQLMLNLLMVFPPVLLHALGAR
jgi:hypothetical protein